MKRGRKSSNNTFTENGKKIWKCGKYKRLSKEDGHDVSYSIENQDAILDYYLANHPEIQVVDNYQDDGRTGTDSDREDFQRLLADIYAKKINCVIVKDLSRLSRNDFECCKTLADSRLEQVVSGHFVKRQKRRRRKGLRTFRPVSARGDSNRPKVQIKPRSCVKSLRSCAFARNQARKQRPRQHR